MYVCSENCKCVYGTYRVNGEDKPVFYYRSSTHDVAPYEVGFEEVHYGLWCHFLSDEEFEKIDDYIRNHCYEE